MSKRRRNPCSNELNEPITKSVRNILIRGLVDVPTNKGMTPLTRWCFKQRALTTLAYHAIVWLDAGIGYQQSMIGWWLKPNGCVTPSHRNMAPDTQDRVASTRLITYPHPSPSVTSMGGAPVSRRCHAVRTADKLPGVEHVAGQSLNHFRRSL